MNNLEKLFFRIVLIFSLGVFFINCEGEDGLNGIDGQDGVDGIDGQDGEDGVDGQDGEDATVNAIFSDKSATPPLVAIAPQFNFVTATSLLSTPDVLDNGFQIAGSVDGAGFLEDPNSDGYIYVVNCEDTYGVARIFLDENLTPRTGDYLLNSGVADFARQCSGTMWEAAIHGGSQDIFLSASESFNYDVKAIDPYVSVPTPTADFGLDALGEFGWENAVPLPQGAYSGQTVIIGGDDDSNEVTNFGQVTLYHSENGDADFQGGSIYVLKFLEVSDGAGEVMAADTTTLYDEADLDFGVSYRVEFVEIENGADLNILEMGQACTGVAAAQFMRVEDVDYQKGSDENGRNVFFAVTGRGPGQGTFNDWGTVYRLELDADSPLTGSLTQVISGNTAGSNNEDGNLAELQSPDNITVTERFIYTQEDPNSFDRGHAAQIYQSDLFGNNITEVLELVVRQDLDPNGSTGFSGEFGALEDISDKVGIPGTFILNLQPHYWESDDFMSLDGHTYAGALGSDGRTGREDDQASQIVLLRGLPR